MAVSILPYAEFGPNDHRDHAPHFSVKSNCVVLRLRPTLKKLNTCEIEFFRNRKFRNLFYNPVSVSTHGLYELLEEGNTYQELIQNLKSNPDDNRKDYYNLQFAFGKVDISIL